MENNNFVSISIQTEFAESMLKNKIESPQKAIECYEELSKVLLKWGREIKLNNKEG